MTTNKYPLVSVIMTVYNGEPYLAESINSILEQTYDPLELIVVDDCSTDSTLATLKTFGDRIMVVSRSINGGIAAGRNSGIRVAHGTFIALADADDIWKPNKLKRQMELFNQHPELDIVHCMLENFISPELPESVRATKRFLEGPIANRVSGTFLGRTTSMKKVGSFNESYRVGEFIDWMARAEESGLMYGMVQEVLYLRRIHQTNTTLNRAAHADYLKIVKAVIDRKRAAR